MQWPPNIPRATDPNPTKPKPTNQTSSYHIKHSTIIPHITGTSELDETIWPECTRFVIRSVAASLHLPSYFCDYLDSSLPPHFSNRSSSSSSLVQSIFAIKSKIKRTKTFIMTLISRKNCLSRSCQGFKLLSILFSAASNYYFFPF